ncbi:SOS response-associated peptidase [Ruoffia tabacinasalis]|jgi:putative SOS response-associated peptidase YedK|uniref:Abasic site processing protein n=1 Tax=Ruoffia tabacinasalis TaxID=87458 RepID=A0ABS0LGQ1_9LACT|nr:SOS response-associated peptidase [Ruoffia tabacinasalis]MBG9977378.1 SOS response-associated peptidase [Ruoffia tabacinasalis]
MCGQYSFLENKKALLERYAGTELDSNLPEDEREVYYPSQNNLILLPNNKFYAIKWGFTPSFAKRPLINARLESILEKQTFIEAFKRKRCLIPATSFYEFKEVDSQEKKERWQIAVAGLDIFSIAGICERYENDDGSSTLTYSMLTKDSEGPMADIHHRVPVILNKQTEREYLNLNTDPNQLQETLLTLSIDLTFKQVTN